MEEQIFPADPKKGVYRKPLLSEGECSHAAKITVGWCGEHWGTPLAKDEICHVTSLECGDCGIRLIPAG